MRINLSEKSLLSFKTICYCMVSVCYFVLECFLIYSFWTLFKETTLPNLTFLNFFWEIPFFFINPLTIINVLLLFLKNLYVYLIVFLVIIFECLYNWANKELEKKSVSDIF